MAAFVKCFGCGCSYSAEYLEEGQACTTCLIDARRLSGPLVRAEPFRMAVPPPDPVGAAHARRKARRARARAGEPSGPVRFGFLRDDGGTPLGKGMPSGAATREDGDTHYEGWMRLIRRDPCAYCGEFGGTVDHIEPKSRSARGLGGAHVWLNLAGACQFCNGKKADRDLLSFLLSRATRGAVNSRAA